MSTPYVELTEEQMARMVAESRAAVERLQAKQAFAAYWAGSISQSVINHYAAGNVRRIVAKEATK